MSPELLTFLWLEDQPDNKKGIVEGIEWTFFCKVENVTHLEAFLEALKSRKVDLILLDLRLPAANGGGREGDVIDPDYGFSALTRFREQHAARDCKTPIDVPVIALTARFDEAARKHAAALNVSEYVIKPFTYRALTDAIRRVLGSAATPRASSSH